MESNFTRLIQRLVLLKQGCIFLIIKENKERFFIKTPVGNIGLRIGRSRMPNYIYFRVSLLKSNNKKETKSELVLSSWNLSVFVYFLASKGY